MAEEDRDSVPGSLSPQHQNRTETPTNSKTEIRDHPGIDPQPNGDPGPSKEDSDPEQSQAKDDEVLPESIPESLLQPSPVVHEPSEHSSDLDNVGQGSSDEILFRSSDSLDAMPSGDAGTAECATGDSRIAGAAAAGQTQKDGEAASGEPDEPECDININPDAKSEDVNDSNSSQNSQNIPDIIASSSELTAAAGAGAPPAVNSEGTTETLPTADIPRVSSQGSLGQIQNSVQALIDKTSGFLDSDPPSLMSSTSDLDQAGLDASSTKFDSIRLDTPSPREQSPLHTSQSEPTEQTSSNIPNTQASSKSASSQDTNCLPANVNSNTNSSSSVIISHEPNEQAKSSPRRLPKVDTEEYLLSQLDAELQEGQPGDSLGADQDLKDPDNPNGLLQRNLSLSQIPEFKALQNQCELLKKMTDQQQQQIKR